MRKTICILLMFCLLFSTSCITAREKDVYEFSDITDNLGISTSIDLYDYIYEISHNQSFVVLLHSDYATYIDAKREYFDALVAEGENAVIIFTNHLRNTKTFGLEETIMAAVCSEITGVGKGGGWSDASKWLDIYDDYLEWGVMPTFWDYDVFLPFPKPECEAYHIEENGDIVCESIGEYDFNKYGYKAYIGNDFRETWFIQNNVAFKMFYTIDYNEIIITLYNKNESDKDDLELIKNHLMKIEQLSDAMISFNIPEVFIVELYAGDAYNKTGIRVFAAFNDDKYLGNFLLNDDNVIESSAPEFMIFPCDLDKDGKYELFTGKSNYNPFSSYIANPRHDIAIYKFGEEKGYLSYTLSSFEFTRLYSKKINDNEIRLFYYKTTEDGYTETELGRLVIEGDELKLVTDNN